MTCEIIRRNWAKMYVSIVQIAVASPDTLVRQHEDHLERAWGTYKAKTRPPRELDSPERLYTGTPGKPTGQTLTQRGSSERRISLIAEIEQIQELWIIFEDGPLQDDDRANLSEQLNTEVNPVQFNMFLGLDPRLNWIPENYIKSVTRSLPKYELCNVSETNLTAKKLFKFPSHLPRFSRAIHLIRITQDCASRNQFGLPAIFSIIWCPL